MALVPAICTQCGAKIEVDNTKEAGICEYCGTAFITEKAINNYVVTNNINVQNASISVSGVNIENLLQRAYEFERSGEKEKALEYFNKVLDENINNEDARAGVKRLTYVHTINIGGVEVPAEPGNKIIELINQGLKVKAIGELRLATGLGLKEAKDAVDLYIAQKGMPSNGYQYNQSTQKSGCYVATAVYGSYDCPEVWTLRRFRDNTLTKSWYGRMFVHAYYALSPTLVKWFGQSKGFKNLCKPFLDNLVVRLNDKGVMNTKYNDKQWSDIPLFDSQK